MSMRILLSAATIASLLLFCSIVQAQNTARADLKNADGKSVAAADFRETKEGALVILRVRHISPGGHAVGIHAVGKCEGPQFSRAGGDFNTGKKSRGFKSPAA